MKFKKGYRINKINFAFHNFNNIFITNRAIVAFNVLKDIKIDINEPLSENSSDV